MATTKYQLVKNLALCYNAGQNPIFRFILDFFCYQHKLVIEVDGHSYADPEQRAYDRARTKWL